MHNASDAFAFVPRGRYAKHSRARDGRSRQRNYSSGYLFFSIDHLLASWRDFACARNRPWGSSAQPSQADKLRRLHQPFISFPKTLFDGEGWCPAELASDLLYVHHAPANVVDITSIDVGRFDSCAGYVDYQPRKLVHRHLPACSYVINLPVGLRAYAGQKRSFNNVIDVGKIARLLAVAVNARSFTFHCRLKELGYHAAIRIVRPLSCAVDVGISHDGR